jgi:hypothetical protein
MKKALLSLLILMSLIGCTNVTTLSNDSTTNTSSSTTTLSTDTTLPIVLATPSNITMNESYVLSWDPVDLATSYLIKINDQVMSVSETSYDLSTMEHNHFYDIQIKAINQNNESLYSEIMELQLFDTIDETINTYYSINSTSDYYLDLIGYGDILDIRYNHIPSDTDENSSFWEFEDDILSINQEFLSSLPVGGYLFIVYFTTGVMSVEITLIENTGPYPIYGQTLKQVMGEDVVIRFDIMNCEFIGLSGNGIEGTDYTFENNILTINSSYLDPLFLDNPTRNIIIGYEFSVGEDTIISFLIIQR